MSGRYGKAGMGTIAVTLSSIVTAGALINMFGELVGASTLLAFVALSIYAWRRTNTNVDEDD